MKNESFIKTFAQKRYGRDIGCPVKAQLLDMVLQVKGLTQINQYYTYWITSPLPPRQMMWDLRE